ncbi:coiled-coil domain-containing protein [Clostridium baratii]|uniref:Uncharacterized protein n=1 Tax=Clostridium baratii TaxID=1561 RepID=A0A174VDV2_9CLOT|nr:hypothetical protein [Clostridium baratii]CUQ30288.1 Uncharacterised protein [Clostridium baratii]
MNKDFLENIKENLIKIKKYYNKNISAKYKGISILLLVGLAFFLSSNFLFNKDFSVNSTELNRKYLLKNLEIQLQNREYNPNTGLVEIMLKIKNTDLSQNTKLKFNIVEKQDVSKKLNVNVIKVDDDNYVVYSKLPLKWSAICLKISIDSQSEIDNKTIVKLYSSSKDTNVNTDLVEEDKLGCTIKFINFNINEINKEIEVNNKKLDSNNEQIKNIENNIKELEDNKKYRTDEENKEAESKITSYKTSISDLKNNNIQTEKLIKEYQERIKKLEEKKVDLKNTKN